MKDRVVVITGASAGIGAALAELVASRGAKPVLLARREDALREVATRRNGSGGGGDALVQVADVTKRDDVKAGLDATLARHGHVDVRVNDAGRGSALYAHATRIAQLRDAGTRPHRQRLVDEGAAESRPPFVMPRR